MNRVNWTLLLIVYLAIVFATAMVSLTSESLSPYMLAVLAAGVPVYFLASGAIMRVEPSVASEQSEWASDGEASVVAFPPHRIRAQSDTPPTAIDAQLPRHKAG